jgi:ABC-2 type transport system ATP-binding protein
MGMDAIRVSHLHKEFTVQQNREGLSGALRDLFNRQYKKVVAVNNISFSIPQGEICGYIGENGAGKSTTIKMLTGILVPSSGEIEVNGFVPYKQRELFVREIGVVFGQRSQLWWDIGVIESFRLLRKVYRVPEREFKQRLDELVERLQLSELLTRPVRKLSLGQRMRCELTAALLHNPKILFLDEPTIGLDILVKSEIREFLLQVNQRYGTTILLTTHDLQDIEALCSRVIMLDDGNIIYDGSLAALKRDWGRGKELQIQFAHACSLDSLQHLTADLAITWSLVNEFTAKAWIPAEKADLSDVFTRLLGLSQIRDLRVLEPNTDEIVKEIYQTGAGKHV